MADSSAQTCAVCDRPPAPGSPPVTVAGRVVCQACCRRIKHLSAEAARRPVDPAASASRPASVPWRPACPSCDTPMRRGRRRKGRRAVPVLVLLTVLLTVVSIVPRDTYLHVGQWLIGRRGDPIWQEKPELTSAANELVGKVRLGLRLTGLVLLCCAGVTVLIPRRVWVCEDCRHVQPRRRTKPRSVAGSADE